MEAKDTVMNGLARKKATGSSNVCRNIIDEDKLLQAQAEISFKAGEIVGYNSGFIAGREWGIKRGIKEVVDAINKVGAHYCFSDAVMEEWQAKLKDWGIE